jgi:hypothetical protein
MHRVVGKLIFKAIMQKIILVFILEIKNMPQN